MLKTMVGGWANTSAGSLSFNTQWNTANPGTSTSSQITWPTVSTGVYACTVYWGDGTSSAITTFNDAAWTHTYPSPGIYTVRIVGTFRGISFNGGGDRRKLLKITQWGGFGFGNTTAFFSGCNNLTITATDLPSMTSTTSFSSAFNSCSVLTTVPSMDQWNMSNITNLAGTFTVCPMFNQYIGSWNVSNVTTLSSAVNGASIFNQDISGWNVGNAVNMNSAIRNCAVFNQNISTWNTIKANNMASMFLGCLAFNQNIGAWNITALLDGTNMLNSVTLSNANYNGLLAGWGAQVAKPNVVFNGGNSHYDSTSGGFNGTAGRAILTGTYTWTITDGGTP